MGRRVVAATCARYSEPQITTTLLRPNQPPLLGSHVLRAAIAPESSPRVRGWVWASLNDRAGEGHARHLPWRCLRAVFGACWAVVMTASCGNAVFLESAPEKTPDHGVDAGARDAEASDGHLPDADFAEACAVLCARVEDGGCANGDCVESCIEGASRPCGAEWEAFAYCLASDLQQTNPCVVFDPPCREPEKAYTACLSQ